MPYNVGDRILIIADLEEDVGIRIGQTGTLIEVDRRNKFGNTNAYPVAARMDEDAPGVIPVLLSEHEFEVIQ